MPTPVCIPRFPLEEARHCRADVSGDQAEHWPLACRWVVPTGQHVGLAHTQETVPRLRSCQGECCYIVAAADEKVRERMRIFRLQLPGTGTELVRRKVSHCLREKHLLQIPSIESTNLTPHNMHRKMFHQEVLLGINECSQH